MRHRCVLSVILASIVVALGYLGVAGTAAAEKGAVRVAAAADLKFALEEILEAFDHQHPDIKVQVTYGSSGNFYAQLSNRAPFDLFLSADSDYPRRLGEQGQGVKGSE